MTLLYKEHLSMLFVTAQVHFVNNLQSMVKYVGILHAQEEEF